MPPGDVASHIRWIGVSVVLAVVSAIVQSVGSEVPEACLLVTPTACTRDDLHPLARKNHAALTTEHVRYHSNFGRPSTTDVSRQWPQDKDLHPSKCAR